MSKPLPKKIEDYKAPWEVSSDGADVPEDQQEIDREKLKRYLFNILTDKERLQAKVTTVEGERDDFKTKYETKLREGESEADRIKRENEELKQKLEKGGEETAEMRALRLEVALDKGISKRDAFRLVGKTRDELEADADAFLEDHGPKKDDDGETTEVSQRPKTKIRSKGDPNEGVEGKELTLEMFPRN